MVDYADQFCYINICGFYSNWGIAMNFTNSAFGYVMLTIIVLAIFAALALLWSLRQKISSSLPDLTDHLNSSADQLPKVVGEMEMRFERLERTLRDETAGTRREQADQQQKARQELATALKQTADSLNSQLNQLTQSNSQKLDQVRDTVETRLEKVRGSVEERLLLIQQDNNKNLEQMRHTVDEKLQGTLEKRLGESFKLVTDRLEQVHKGLGEMQALAVGVGDLKRVLGNVKSRGVFGEVQLAALLEDVLTPEQYVRNISVRNNDQRVEFAIRLPGTTGDADQHVLLPIDAKFPLENYRRLVEAQEKLDTDAVHAAGRALEVDVEYCAADISGKYINPPVTTDFAILFLPSEGLFAEVARREGLVEKLQRKLKITMAGPTTLWSILTSIQMGFRTLAIQKHSSEVWNVLSEVKTEFQKFGESLDRVQKKLQDAQGSIEDVATRKRAMERKLKGVQTLPVGNNPPPLLASANDGE